nr:uncharacterized protein CTRU02_06270 [Colletotrichum truncatum]KAF6792774.1 hypothetical protein CTRU02_06270 [Colletotrichum truncatum]
MSDHSRFSDWTLQDRNPAIFPVAGQYNEIDDVDGETVTGEGADDVDSTKDQSKAGDYLIQLEDDDGHKDPELQYAQATDGEPDTYWRHPTAAASGKNWLLILIGFLSAYSMYNYSEGIPEEDRIFIDWFLKWAMGPFWEPTTGYLVVVILLYIASNCVLAYRQGLALFLMAFVFSGSFGHLLVALWRGNWGNVLLADIPLRLNVVVFLVQIFITVQHRSGRGFSRGTLLQEVKRVVARKKDDCEAQESGGRGDANDGTAVDGGEHRESYGAC